MENIIFFDTETGGTNPDKHSLLSVGMVAWNRKDGIIDRCEVFLKSDTYSFTQKAIELNKFDRVEHDAVAVPHDYAVDVIRGFCIKNAGKKEEIQIAGHNIQFDVAFLTKLFKEQNRSFSSLFSHRMIDTFSILKFLNDAKKIDINPISSSNAFKLFNIKVDKRHSALGDAAATAELYEALIKMIE